MDTLLLAIGVVVVGLRLVWAARRMRNCSPRDAAPPRDHCLPVRGYEAPGQYPPSVNAADYNGGPFIWMHRGGAARFVNRMEEIR